MISIRYPGFPSGVDFNGISGAFSDAFDRERGFRQERQGIDAFGQYLDTMGGPGMSLAALGRNDGVVQRAPLAAPADVPTQRVAQAHAASGGMPSVGDMTAYIAKAAAARGIDPGVAIRVAKSEGLAPNTWQSNFAKGGKREPSYGPYQLLVGGGETGFPEGMGNDFQKATGLDPSDPANWQKAVDFALDRAAQGGWTPWYGAEKAGIGPWDGIRRGQAQQPTQVADASGGAPMPAQGTSDSLLPPRDVMMALFRSPDTRQLAVGLAQAAQKMRAGQNDPMAEIEYRKALLELRNLENPQPKPTDDMREYEFARQQGYQGSLQDWITSGRKAGATTVNVGEGSGEYRKALDKKLAEQSIAIQEGAQTARGKLATLDALGAALQQSGQTGWGSETLLTVQQAGRSLGLDIGDNLDAKEAARALGNQLALQLRNPSSGAGMPGAMSDKDREFLVSSVPGLTKTPEGNARLIEFMKRIEQRNIEVARLAQEYEARNGQIDNGFFKELGEWADANPLFPDTKGNRTQSGVQWSIEND